jgi:uncharacterized protein DUF4038/collagenase-like protein with putative collagen-binding domain
MKRPGSICASLWMIVLLAHAVQCLAQGAALPQLRVSANGRYLVKQDGSAFVYLADTAWTLLHWTREDVDTYLQDRAQKGFTVIQISVSGFDEITNPNAYGQTMFVGQNPHQPNDAYFQQLDYVVDKAASLGIYLALVPLWANNYERPAHIDGFPDDAHPDVLDRSSAFTYGKFLGARYRNKPVIWIVGGDWFFVGYEDVWRAMAAGLTEGGDGAHQLLTFHQKPKAPLLDEPWLDFHMIQTSHTIWNRSYDLIALDWDRVPAKPVVMGEGGYEGIADHTMETVHTIDAADVRRIAYCAFFAGAAGYAYGAQGVWGYHGKNAPAPSPAHAPAAAGRWGGSPPWQEGMQLPAGKQMRYLRTLLESRPMLTRIPDQWLIADDQLSTVNRIQACRAADGSYAFIYTASGTRLRIQLVDHGDAFPFYKKLSGTRIRAYWYDPRHGTSLLIDEFDKVPFRDFTPPSSGPGNDWVLVLDDASKGYAAPGTMVSNMKAGI